MTPELAHQIRTHHQPTQCANCAYHVCRSCRDKWPCPAERQVRSEGYRPIGIDDYPVQVAVPAPRVAD